MKPEYEKLAELAKAANGKRGNVARKDYEAWGRDVLKLLDWMTFSPLSASPQPPQQIPEPPTEYGWLLEYRPDVSSNVYWLGRNLLAEFNAFEALRFGTKADAEAFLKLMIGPVRQLGDGSDWLAVEHAFDAAMSAQGEK